MKVKVEDLKDSQKLIRIEVEPERVSAVLDDVYGDIQKTAHIPGYRVGKAPRDLLERRHGQTADNEAVNRLVWECYREAIVQQKIEPVGYPVVVEDAAFNRGSPLKFAVKVDVAPEFNLKSYKGIKLKNEPVEVTAEDVDLALKNIQESLAQFKNIEGRPVAMGDYIVCDYECFVDGKSVDKNNKLWLYISEQLQPRQLLDALLGTERDITKEVEVDHPQDYHYKEVAGKKALYRITPKEIKEKSIPPIDDNLAKDAGSFKDLEELKGQIRENLLRAKNEELRHAQEEQINKNLLQEHSFDIPRSMAERQLQHLIEDAKLRLLYQGYKRQDLDKEDDNLKKALQQKAQDSVRLFFILQAIARREGIEATDAELDARIAHIAEHTKQNPEDAKRKMQENHLIDDLREQVVQDKVTEFLLTEAKK